MDHVLGDVAAGEFPEQAPVDEFESVEVARAAAVEESVPIHVLRSAIKRNGADPLRLAVGSVSAHPGFNLRDLADDTVLDPFASVGQGTGAFVLQADLNHAVGCFDRAGTIFPLRE